MPPRSRTTLPLVRPIVPVLRGVPFDDPAWLFEPKYDGFRGLLYVSPRNCWFRSKRRNTMTRFQELAEQVRDELRVRSAILDGEIVSLDEDGRQIFRRMLAGRGHLHGAAFDLFWLNGKDLPRYRSPGGSSASPGSSRPPRRSCPAFSPSSAAAGTCWGLLSSWTSKASWRSGRPILGPETTWYKIKNRAYTQAEGRWELFQKG
jgi:hypothetical protein